MIIKNVKVYTEDERFVPGEIVIRDGVFAERKRDTRNPQDDAAGRRNRKEEVIDGEGCYAIPGLIDLHFHGCKGYDFCDGTKEAITEIAKYEASIGVTAIAPATMTLPVEELERILAVAAGYRREIDAQKERLKQKLLELQNVLYEQMKESEERMDVLARQVDLVGINMDILTQQADLVGINMEGPFISRKKKGAQDEKHIIPCDAAICQRFLDASEGLVRFVGVAPECSENAVEFIRQMKDKVNISLAHTNADYDTAMAAFQAGANHAVHLYNAMPTFTHREPGVVGAVADSAHVDAELICDGVHIHPAMVRSTFKMLGAERMILISDSMRATGMPDGRYMLGGLEVDVVGNRATLVSDGALAGSATNLMDCMRTAVQKMGIPLETAVACATKHPAQSLGIYGEYGSITPGKKGNVVLLDENLQMRAVIKDGIRIR